MARHYCGKWPLKRGNYLTNLFQNRQPNTGGNCNIRTPQLEAYQALVNYYQNETAND